MAFTYNADLSDDVSLVRFHIGDTSEDGFYLHDATIQYFVTAGSVGQAVVSCILYILTQLSQPDFRLDWMSVSNAEARKGFETLLKLKRQEFGINLATAAATISHAHRADSYEADSDGNYTVPDGSPGSASEWPPT